MRYSLSLSLSLPLFRLSASYQLSDDKRKGESLSLSLFLSRYLERRLKHPLDSIYSAESPTDFVDTQS